MVVKLSVFRLNGIICLRVVLSHMVVKRNTTARNPLICLRVVLSHMVVKPEACPGRHL